ncbi:MAG: LysE family translocator [Reyranella sp.]|nr:LysE family translocator [Reyranella sp.]
MTMASLWAFLAVSFLVIATPGPDTALTVRNTLIGGRRGGGFTALGIAAGQAIWALGTSLGLVALLMASEMVFEAVRWLGAAYLLYLGAASLWSAWRGRAMRREIGVVQTRLTPAAAFRQGLLSDLGNPKMAVFFSSMLPQFADDFAGLVLHGLLFGAMTLLWLTGYACVLSRAGDYLRRGPVGRLIEAATGAALVALGLRLASEQR